MRHCFSDQSSQSSSSVRLIALSLAVVLMLGLLAGCAGTTSPSQAPASAAGEASAAPTATVAEPATAAPEKRPVITYWEELWVGKQTTLLASLDDSVLYKELQKRLNVEIEFQHPPTGQALEKFNVMISSGSLTDIVEYGLATSYPGGPEKAVQDGVVMDLTPLIAEKAPNLSKVMAQHPDWAKGVYNDAGMIWSFPFFRGHDFLRTWYGAAARTDLLAKAGIAAPKTIGDWYSAAKEIKSKGVCEYPILIQNLGIFGSYNVLPGAWGVGWEYYIKTDGKIGYGPLEPGFKDFIAEMNKWYKEGLMDPDVVVGIETKDFQSKITTDKSALTLMAVGGGIGFYYGSIKKERPEFLLEGLPYPTVDGSKSRFGNQDPNMAGQGYWINAKTKELDACMKVLDYGYGEEGHLLFNFGVEGQSFDWVDAKTIDAPIDVVALGDRYPLWKPEIITKNPDYSMSDALGPWVRSHGGGPFIQDARYFTQFLQFDDQKKAVATWMNSSDFSSIMNYVNPTVEEAAIIADKQAAMITYRDEMLVQFITGDKPMTDWDDFVAEMKKMGAEDLLAIRQAGYERMLKR